MSKQPKDKRPYLPPVTRIELSEENIRGRWILLILLVCIAAGAIGWGIHYAVDVQPGWNEIQAICDAPNYSTEFHLMYDFSRTGRNAAAVNKALSLLYSDAMENGYRFFSKDAQEDGLHNLFYLNQHVNQVITIEEPLYEALELLQEYGNRCIYLAPVYVEYNRVFNSDSDGDAMLYDPHYDEESAAYIAQLMHFAGSEEKVNLELLGNHQVELFVSEDYLAFAGENGIEAYLDFGWMRNAFIADYVAELLKDGGYTSGYLSSYDGFNRSLEHAAQLDFNIFDRQGMDVYAPGRITYSGGTSLVFIRDYPLSDLDQWCYHVYADGHITSSIIDPADGTSGICVPNLLSYSTELSCSRILLEVIPYLFGGEFTQREAKDLAGTGIWSIWSQNGKLFYNQENLQLELLENAQGVRYEAVFIP